MNPCSSSASVLETSCTKETVLNGSNFLQNPNGVLLLADKVDCLGHAKGNNSFHTVRLRMFSVNPIMHF